MFGQNLSIADRILEELNLKRIPIDYCFIFMFIFMFILMLQPAKPIGHLIR